MRAKALAERAVAESGVPHTIFAPVDRLRAGDVFLTLLERMALLPVVRSAAPGARSSSRSGRTTSPTASWPRSSARPRERYELSGPETLSYDAIVEIVLRAAGRPRPLVHVPLGVVSRSLRTLEALMRSKAFATWDEAELMEVSHDRAAGPPTPRRSACARAHRVRPRRTDRLTRKLRCS
jgi:NADH dehydrogenase